MRPDANARTETVADDTRIPSQAAYLLTDRGGRVVASQHEDVIDTPMLAGSLMKIVTIVAARDSGVLDASTRIECPREVRIEGRVLDCVHAPLGRAPDARATLAHSCNAFVASVATRLARSALSGSAVEAGLPAVPASASLALASLGLDGARATPRTWLRAFRRVVEREQQRASGSFVLDGLRDAARVGSARALGARGFDVYAKTGTAPMPGGGTAGLVVVATPGLEQTLIVVAPGGAGRDAADIAARVLAARGVEAAGPPAGYVRVGRVLGGAYRVERVAVEAYVAGVVDAEAPADATAGLRRTLAIVSRTWLARHADRHAAEGFDVCDLTHCQVFREARATGSAAAAETRGVVLVGPDREPVDAEYSASCGGRLETGPDPAGIDHGDAWRAELDHRALLAALAPMGVAGARIDRMAVVARTASGRARTLVVHTDRDYELDAERAQLAIGRALGWQHVKSTWFDIAPYSRGFVFTGRGHGHGRGLCVRGAVAMDARGDTPEQILNGYFPTAGLSLDATATVVDLDLPPSVAHRRALLETAVRTHAATLATRLSRGAPASIALRVHPTIESFQRATGLGWGRGARTRGAVIDMAPLDALERRGRFDVSLRHELVHVLTAAALEGRPRWAHEGLAVVMARETIRAIVPEPLSCPQDEEFAGDAEALPMVYARAARCAERDLARGAWRDVGASR